MQNVYENCPVFENERFEFRLLTEGDIDDLLEVYSDKNALPFFNSDNCDGDNFYYPTRERMAQAVDFWLYSYREKWFVRWTIVDKTIGKAIGTIEMFHRLSEDAFNHMGLLRLDVRSDYEKADVLRELFALCIPPAFELFGCDTFVTKIPIYAVERAAAASQFGFTKSDELLLGGEDRYLYNGYWTVTSSPECTYSS